MFEIARDHTLDLTFKPVSNPAPAVLTAQQIAFYNREGYIAPFEAFSAAEAAGNRAYFDRLLATLGDGGAYRIDCYQARLAGIWDLCTNSRILDAVEDIVGSNIICWASHFFCKLPHDPKPVGWHQDASFWKLSPARTVTVWLAIDDADAGNAAMQFIPRSHDRGHLEFTQAGGQSVLSRETVGAETMGNPISNDLAAGHFSMHADMLVHGSRRNASNRRRCGLTIRYCPPEVNATDSNWAGSVEAIVCRGTAAGSWWTHHPRPENDDIAGLDRPTSIGGN